MGTGLRRTFAAFGMAASVLTIGAPALAQAREMTGTPPAAEQLGKLLHVACQIDAAKAPFYGKAILSSAAGNSDFNIDLSGLNDERCDGAKLNVSGYDGTNIATATTVKQDGRSDTIDRTGDVKGVIRAVNFRKAGQEADCVEKLSAQGIRPDPRDGGAAQIRACMAKPGP